MTTPHRATAEEWRAVREIRLASLAADPDAFGSTLEQGRALTEEVWRERLDSANPTFLVRRDGEPVAMGGGLLIPDSDAAMVWGMWTAREHRGRGYGRSILDAVVDWAHEQQRTPYLHVAQGNPARRLYLDRGFRPTGAWNPLRDGSPVRIEEMVLRPATGSPR